MSFFKPKTALILGGARNVFEDYERAMQLFEPDTVIAVNDSMAEFPNVEHFATMHPKKASKWLEKRRAKGFADPKRYWTATDRAFPEGFEFQTIHNTRGGSGLLAVYVARYLGYDKKILAGIPMSPEMGHFFDEREWKECKLYRVVWEHNATLREDTRSLSGWTMQTFGFPEIDWINN